MKVRARKEARQTTANREPSTQMNPTEHLGKSRNPGRPGVSQIQYPTRTLIKDTEPKNFVNPPTQPPRPAKPRPANPRPAKRGKRFNLAETLRTPSQRQSDTWSKQLKDNPSTALEGYESELQPFPPSALTILGGAAVRRSGEVLPYAGLPGRIVAPNLTPDPETGAGSWTADQLARAIREGVGHDGRALFPIMPYQHYRDMSDEDLASVVVYLRSLPAVHNQLPAPQVRGQNVSGMDFARGFPFTGPWGTVASANITPNSSGIPYYDEALFLKVMRNGQVEARELSPIMPVMVYKNLTDDDLKAIFAFLRTTKPVKHRVDNSEAPTECKLCKQKHGGGSEN
jgi:hypothetical protein